MSLQAKAVFIFHTSVHYDLYLLDWYPPCELRRLPVNPVTQFNLLAHEGYKIEHHWLVLQRNFGSVVRTRRGSIFPL